MAQVKVQRLFALPAESVRLKAQQIADKLGSEYGLSCGWGSQDRIDFASSKGITKGVSGTLQLTGSQVDLVINLPLMLSGMQRKIQAEAERIVADIEAGR